MGRFEFLKPFRNAAADHSRHVFFPINESEIVEAESRMGRPFPGELRELYMEVGYGFVCSHDKQGFNRIMAPRSVADFALGEGIYRDDPDRELYEDPNHLAFFEASEGVFLTLDLASEQEDGTCPVYYFDTKVAESLLEFIRRMDQQTDYYVNM